MIRFVHLGLVGVFLGLSVTLAAQADATFGLQFPPNLGAPVAQLDDQRLPIATPGPAFPLW